MSRHVVRCLVIVYIFAYACPHVSDSDKDPDEFINRGIAALDNDDIAVALKAFRDALALAPTNATMWQAVGAAHAAGGEHDDSIKHYIQASVLEPDVAENWYSTGHAFAVANRLSESEMPLRRAMDVAGTTEEEISGAAATDLGTVLANSARPSEAEAMFSHALELMPSDLEIPLKLGRLLAVLPGRYNDAADLLVPMLLRTTEKLNASGYPGSGVDDDVAEIRNRVIAELRSLVARMPRVHLSGIAESRTLVQADDGAAKVLMALAEFGEPKFDIMWELGQSHASSDRHNEAEDAYRRA